MDDPLLVKKEGNRSIIPIKILFLFLFHFIFLSTNMIFPLIIYIVFFFSWNAFTKLNKTKSNNLTIRVRTNRVTQFFKKPEEIRLDPIFWISMIFFALSIGLNVSLVTIPEQFLISIYAMGISIFGLIGFAFYAVGAVSHTFELKTKMLDSSDVITIGLFVGIGLALTTISSQILQAVTVASITDYTLLLFGVISAVSEEAFFLAVQSIVEKLFSIVVALPVVVITFTIYHIAVYADIVSNLVFVLILRIINAVLYYLSNRPSIPILIHLINNVFALAVV